MNTTAKDNATYYGKGAGSFKAQFSGTFSKTNIQVDAVAGHAGALPIQAR